MATNDRVTAKFDGKSIYITEGTVHALDALAKSMGWKDHTVLSCYQGGWVGASSYSGNTHGKEAVDLSASDGAKKVKNGRLLGIWLDQRLPTEGPWVKHIHGARLSPGASFLAPSMTGQQNAYLVGKNGLINGKKDDDFRPRYPNIRFVDDGVHERWIALKATTGYSQPGGHKDDAKVQRAKGWTWGSENIATVRVNNVEYLVTQAMTFYRKSDFAVYAPTNFVTERVRYVVAEAPAYGRVAPDLNSKKVTGARKKGFAFWTVGYTKVNGKTFVRSVAGAYYARTSLDVHKDSKSSDPVAVTPPPVTAFQTTVAGYNVIVNRLSPKDPPKIGDWKKGETWEKRAPLCAKMVRGASVVATAEAGSQSSVALLNKALGTSFQSTVWGDGWDISQAVHFDSNIHKKLDTQAVTMVPAGPGSSHNIANLTHLEEKASGIDWYVCALHLIAGNTLAAEKQRGQQVKNLVPQVLKIAGNKPVLYIGDLNSGIGQALGVDEVGKAFKSFGITDAENTDCAVINPKYDSYNGLVNPPKVKSVQLDRALAKPGDIKFRKREVIVDLVAGKHRTPWPADHQPMKYEITVYRK
jgi:hypothetical protein